MSYATLSDITELNTARTFSSTTKPTDTQVADWLDQGAAVIDSILRRHGYALPVPTGATSTLKALEHYNAVFAHAMVEQGAQASDRRDDAMKMWESAKKMLESGDFELDSGLDTTDVMPRAPDAPSAFFYREMNF